MATQYQSVGNSILTNLGFEIIPARDDDGNPIIGGEQTFKATSDTVAYVQKLLEQGQVLVLDSDAAIRVEDAGTVA